MRAFGDVQTFESVTFGRVSYYAPDPCDIDLPTLADIECGMLFVPVDRSAEAAALRRVLPELPPRQREVIVLRELSTTMQEILRATRPSE